VSPTTIEGIRAAVLAAATALAGEEVAHRQEIALERPPRPELGDYSTNAALLLAKGLATPPREVAEQLGAQLALELGGSLDRFEVAGPGFLNLFLAEGWLAGALRVVLDAGEAFGAGGAQRAGTPERILVEFVSANPTGPMHVGHARNAAYGDALARVLSFHGHDVAREFYVNDAGSQVHKLGESIQALARGEEVPEDGYKGDYVKTLLGTLAEGAARDPAVADAAAIDPSAIGSTAAIDPASLDPAELGRTAVAVMVGQTRASLEGFGVKGFDHWIYESELFAGEPSPVEHTLALLEQQGHTYRSEGALWLRTTAYGDDKDRVLVRSSGEHTYFASDIAYHQDKRERGFERQIDVWGADHHGYMARMKAAYEALGGDPGHLEMLIMQLVHLVRRGERAQMSKRAGEFVTLDDLVVEIGVDAARWFLLSRSHDTTIDLDLDLAREESAENPVYYVQYAHARIASVLAKAGAERVAAALDTESSEAGGPLHASERGLVKRLLAYPGEIEETARRRAPHRIAAYALELAQEFTAFYRDCHVLDVQPPELESSRIALCVATQRVIASSLQLLGVSAPSEM
jgi:arginyl-tRNA synthetase